MLVLYLQMAPSNTVLIQLIQETIAKQIDPLKKEMDLLVESIDRDLKLNYLNSIARFLQKEAVETVDNFICSHQYSTSVECKQSLKSYFSKYTQALAMGDMANAFAILKEFEELAIRNVNDNDKGGNCPKDWRKIGKVLSRHKDVAKDMSALYMAREIPSDIGELEFSPEEIFKEVVFPFSHPLRIQLIYALKSGSKRFTTLKEELKVKNTGLLVHHLKPLTGSGLVVQDHRKQYLLTEKGYIVAKYFAQIAAAMHPEEPTMVNVQPLIVLSD
jgi:DNA-binding HxlR family transcriptional regulator